MLLGVDDIYVFSLASRSDRLARAREMLERLGLPFKVFETFDGCEMRLSAGATSSYLCRPTNPTGSLPAGRIGSYISFTAFFREAARCKYGNILVLEDDAVLRDDFVTKANAAIAALPSKWDMLYFGCWDWKESEAVYVNELIYRPGFPILRHAVLHSSSSWEKLVEYTRRFSETMDVSLARKALEWNVFATRECLSWQFDGNDSDGRRRQGEAV
jgi:GR25 family glycosyltransferase involved in LPS biosynthesis